MKKLTSEQLDKFYLELNVGNLDIAGLIRALCVYGNVETFFVLRLDEYKTLIKCCIEKVETSGKVIEDYTLKIKIR